MATVRISAALVEAVKSVIARMKRAELARIDAELPQSPAPIVPAELVERFIFGDKYDLMLSCPNEWFSTDNRFPVKVRLDGINAVGLECASKSAYRHPFGWSVYNRSEVSPDFAPEIRAFFDAKQGRAAVEAPINAKYIAINEQVVGLLSASASLNAALKVFPELKLYVPQEYLDKVEEKVERAPKPKDQPVFEFDKGLLVSAGVAAKLMGV